jgi:ABC-2 type transport system permease protein
MLLFLFWLLGGMELGKHVFVGWLVSLGASGGIAELPQTVLRYKQFRLQEVFVAAPVHPLSYMTAFGLRALFTSLAAWGFVLPVMYVLDLLPAGRIPLVLVVLLLTWAMASAIGFTIAMAVRRIAIISLVATMVWLLLGSVPPVLYPVDLVPEAFQWVAWLFPTAHIAQLLRGILGMADLAGWEFLMHSLVPLAVTCGLLVWVAARSRWREV